jgi:hypothetical protein
MTTTEQTMAGHACDPAHHCDTCHEEATTRLIARIAWTEERAPDAPVLSLMRAALAGTGCRCGCE